MPWPSTSTRRSSTSDRAGKQDLLKYSYGEFLDGLAANRSVSRKRPRQHGLPCASRPRRRRTTALAIPAGIRVTTVTESTYHRGVRGDRSRRRICGRGGGLHRRGDGGEQFPPRPGGHSGRPPALHPERGNAPHRRAEPPGRVTKASRSASTWPHPATAPQAHRTHTSTGQRPSTPVSARLFRSPRSRGRSTSMFL